MAQRHALTRISASLRASLLPARAGFAGYKDDDDQARPYKEKATDDELCTSTSGRTHAPPAFTSRAAAPSSSWPGLSAETQRHYSSTTPVMGRLQGFRFQLPSNPFSAARKKPPVPRLVLYKGRGMLPFRLIVRAKVFQAVGAFTIAMLVSAMITAQDFKPWDLAAAGGLALGCVVTSYCVWYYSSRYVGELSLLLPDRRVARFSVLDFYGNRQDDDIPVEDIVAPFHNRTVGQVKALTARVLLPVDVRGGEHQYYISVAHGYILEKQVLLRLFYGKHLDDLDAELAARTALAGQAPEPAGPAAGLAGQTAATSAGHSAGSPGSASADGAAVADLSAPAPATPARRE